MNLLRHKSLHAIAKLVLFISTIVLFANQLSRQFYVQSSDPLFTHWNIEKYSPNFSQSPQFPIQKYNAGFSIDKRYYEPVTLVLQTCPFCLVSLSEQAIIKYAFLTWSPLDSFHRVVHLRGPPVC